MIKIKRGLDIPIKGAPKQVVEQGAPVSHIGVIGYDFVGMKPSMKVKEGDAVKIGQPLFECKKVPGVVYTAPASGTVSEINRGDRRVFESLVIKVTGDEYHSFENYTGRDIGALDREEITKLLVESGLWASFRTRPFSKAPAIDSHPSAIFINAMDTNPLCADPEILVSENKDDFIKGVEVISKLTFNTVHVIKKEGSNIESPYIDHVMVSKFDGPHPAGNVGTHIHYLEPVSANKMVWTINYRDVIAVGKLFTTGKLWTEKLIAVGGPLAKNPRLLRTRMGADLKELLANEFEEGAHIRKISVSLLNGRTAHDHFRYLGYFHNQVTLLEEDHSREFLGWKMPGFNKFSITKAFAASMFPNKMFNMTTTQSGSFRAMVPIESFEKVMPMDILPTQLLRSLVMKDTDHAQELGALELDEEDLALCTFVSPGKTDFGLSLRECLTIIEKEG